MGIVQGNPQRTRLYERLERNWVFPTNSDILIPLSLQHNVVDISNYKLC